MQCYRITVYSLSLLMIWRGVLMLVHQITRSASRYGRYCTPTGVCYSSRSAWFLQEVPALLMPLLMLIPMLKEHDGSALDWRPLLILGAFMLHYFHRSFIYAFLTHGRPVPRFIVFYSAAFCALNGSMQGHFLLHCAHFDASWSSDRRIMAGLLIFAVGMSINIHSDYILRNLRKPGELVYRIPHGGMFEFVSGANFLGEIIEWSGYALASWSLPTFAFAFFTVCSIGPRAWQHHRDYKQRFQNYPSSRKAIIPFLL